MKGRRSMDRVFLLIIALLVVGGLLIFSSASLGLLARDGAQFSSVAFNQIVLGVGLGSILLAAFANFNYRYLRPVALYFLIGSMLLTLLVFVPGIGLEFGGAKRWISIFGISLQPAELLKLSAVLYFASYLTAHKGALANFREGLIPLTALIGAIGVLLLAQPDTDTFLVIVAALVAMYLAAGARFRDVALLGGAGLAGLAILILTRPYIRDRFLTFLNPAADPMGSGYQIQQSLIAIGSGEWFGRGFGQSIQKFSYLPEAIGDSVFAVAAEEFGFIGSLLIITAFVIFAFRGLQIAAKSPDLYGGLVTVGIVILIVSQSFINIGSMLGVLPLTGIPLPFISHGGTAMMVTLAQVGIVLNISRYQKG